MFFTHRYIKEECTKCGSKEKKGDTSEVVVASYAG